MPYKLFPPSFKRRSPYYTVRGTEFGIRVNRSTKTANRREALVILRQLQADALAAARISGAVVFIDDNGLPISGPLRREQTAQVDSGRKPSSSTSSRIDAFLTDRGGINIRDK